MAQDSHASGHTPPAGPPDATVDPAQQSLVSALRSSFAILRLVLVVLVVLYLGSGVFQIGPGEQGVIARLGELVINKDTGQPVFTKGWIWWALPAPFDEQIKLSGNIRKLETDTFLFRRRPEDIVNKTDIATIRPLGNTLKPGVDGAMLTGDKALSHGLWDVEYQITDAAKFVTRVGEHETDVEPLLQRLFESAIVREVAHRTVEEVTTTKKDAIRRAVRNRLQQELDGLDVGVDVVEVYANTIVPAQVAPAFDEVTRAENERKQQEHVARQKATEILNQAAGAQYEPLLREIHAYGAAELADADAQQLTSMREKIDALLEDAQGEVASRVGAARADANSIRERISEEYDQFTYWLEQYRRFPQATLVNLWSQMREEILDNKDNEVFWVPASNVIEVLVNRDPNRRLEAEREQYKKEAEQSP
jgi:membrane protease subunit HflK